VNELINWNFPCRIFVTRPMSSRYKIQVLLAVLATGLSALVFLPGITGPFIFDDFANIVKDHFLKFDHLTLSNLYQAALSSNSGPLKRPIAMLTFALNSWLAGGTSSAESFKLWNIGIHGLNAILLLTLTYQILSIRNEDISHQDRGTKQNQFNYPILFSAIVGILWVVNPIQVTSVLYVVQRMTSLSALFTIVGLISYVYGRRYLEKDIKKFLLYCCVNPVFFLLLGLFSKENAILLPVFFLVLELTIFSDRPIWTGLDQLKYLKLFIQPWFIFIAVSLGLVASIYIVLPGYQGRLFTLPERLMTESRVISIYVFLILIPRVAGFAVHHDDLAISQGLLTPPTTLLSILFLLALAIIGWKLRKKQPYISFGILFFFSGHLLESTIVPLEIMHEHRNYLPSYGLIFAVATSVDLLGSNVKYRLTYLLIPVLFVTFSLTTIIRSYQWSNLVSLYSNEVIHHPGSVRTLVEYSGVLNLLHKNNEAVAMLERAIQLQPDNPVLYIELRKYNLYDSNKAQEVDNKIDELLKRYPLNPFLRLQMESVLECLPAKCKHLLKPYENWLITILNRKHGLNDPSYYLYLLGRANILEGKGTDAILAMRASISIDPAYMQPRFALFNLYIASRNLESAHKTLEEIKHLSLVGQFKWTNEIREAESTLKSQLRRTPSGNSK